MLFLGVMRRLVAKRGLEESGKPTNLLKNMVMYVKWRSQYPTDQDIIVAACSCTVLPGESVSLQAATGCLVSNVEAMRASRIFLGGQKKKVHPEAAPSRAKILRCCNPTSK